MSSTPAAYRVFGNPVRHSLSPQIHAAFASATGEVMTYDLEEVPVDHFATHARAFFDRGEARGANVTLPFKEDARNFADRCDESASRAGAANTLAQDDSGHIVGYNTDGAGLVADLIRLNARLVNAEVVILGAGGAVRGVVQPLLDAGVRHLTISNRTVERAERLVGHFDDDRLRVVPADDLDGFADLVINGTSAGLRDEIPAVPERIVRGAVCYDMIYSSGETAFCRWARQHGAMAAHDGLGMLVEQAAESFRIWRGVRPDTADVLKRLSTEVS